MDVEAKIREIKTQISQAQARQVRAQVEREQAQRSLDQAREALMAEFGVATPGEARAMLTELQTTLDKALADVTEALAS